MPGVNAIVCMIPIIRRISPARSPVVEQVDHRALGGVWLRHLEAREITQVKLRIIHQLRRGGSDRHSQRRDILPQGISIGQAGRCHYGVGILASTVGLSPCKLDLDGSRTPIAPVGGGVLAVPVGGGACVARAGDGACVVPVGGSVSAARAGGGVCAVPAGGGACVARAGDGVCVVPVGGSVSAARAGGGFLAAIIGRSSWGSYIIHTGVVVSAAHAGGGVCTVPAGGDVPVTPVRGGAHVAPAGGVTLAVGGNQAGFVSHSGGGNWAALAARAGRSFHNSPVGGGLTALLGFSSLILLGRLDLRNDGLGQLVPDVPPVEGAVLLHRDRHRPAFSLVRPRNAALNRPFIGEHKTPSAVPAAVQIHGIDPQPSGGQKQGAAQNQGQRPSSAAGSNAPENLFHNRNFLSTTSHTYYLLLQF